MTHAQNYASFFENIDKDTPVDDFKLFFDLEAKFKDPFHELCGIENIYNVFQKMYENLDDPRFKVDEVVVICSLRQITCVRFKS